MASFLTALQFLTRLRAQRQTAWRPEEFGRSVRWFPLVGAVLGAVYAACARPLLALPLPTVRAVVLLVLPVLLTGGLFLDGFMDSMDGLFSNRPRERVLEIMKDSRVGANAVFAFVSLMFAQFAALSDLAPMRLPPVMFLTPILGRLMLVIAIRRFPYARPQGMGKAFKEFSDGATLPVATLGAALPIAALLLLAPTLLPLAVAATLVAVLFTLAFGAFVARRLGGLTGDIYGATVTLAETLVLLTFAIGGVWL